MTRGSVHHGTRAAGDDDVGVDFTIHDAVERAELRGAQLRRPWIAAWVANQRRQQREKRRQPRWATPRDSTPGSELE